MKLLYEAELNPKGFLTGVRQVEAYTARAVTAGHRLQLAFRHFERGNLGRGFTHLGGAIGQAGRQMRDLGLHAFEAGRRIVGGLQGGISILSRYVAIGGIVTGILGGVATKLMILDSAKFDSTIGRTALQSGATPEQRAKLAAVARDTGVETPFGPQAVANTMKAGSQRGWDPEEIVQMTDAVKRFAVVADMDLEQAGEVLSQVMFQFDIPMEKAVETAYKLANATVATSLAGNELFDALKFAGGAAGVFKVNLTELLAVLGTLRRVADASVASTSLRNIMLMATAIKSRNPKQMAELGLDDEDAEKLTFMSGDPKGIVDVVKHIKTVFDKEPEMAMRAGFGTRTLVAMEQIAQVAGRAGDLFGNLQARIDDVDEAQRQYNESLQLADNLFRRLQTSASAVLMSIGTKLREALGIDDAVSGLGDKFAEISRIISAMPKENVTEIVESLGAGMIQAFGTAVAFLIRAMGPVALAFGDLLFKGIVAAGKSLMDSDESKSYVAEYRSMSPAEREAERKRLGGIFGQPDGLTTLSGPNVGFGVADDNTRMLRRRAAAMLEVNEGQSGINDTLNTAMSGLRHAFSSAMEDLRGNSTVMAAQKGVEAAQAARLRESTDAAAARMAPPGGEGGVNISNNGVINNYGAFSAGARARPTRPSGKSSQEMAQK